MHTKILSNTLLWKDQLEKEQNQILENGFFLYKEKISNELPIAVLLLLSEESREKLALEYVRFSRKLPDSLAAKFFAQPPEGLHATVQSSTQCYPKSRKFSEKLIGDFNAAVADLGKISVDVEYFFTADNAILALPNIPSELIKDIRLKMEMVYRENDIAPKFTVSHPMLSQSWISVARPVSQVAKAEIEMLIKVPTDICKLSFDVIQLGFTDKINSAKQRLVIASKCL